MTLIEAVEAEITTVTRPSWEQGKYLRIQLEEDGKIRRWVHVFTPQPYGVNSITADTVSTASMADDDFVEYNGTPDELDAAKREITRLRSELASAKAKNVEFHRELVKFRTPCRHKYDPARAEDKTECGYYVEISNNFSNCPHCGRQIIVEHP